MFMGLVTSLHGCAYPIPSQLCYTTAASCDKGVIMLVIAFQNSLSMSEVMSQVGQP